jgi:hypothetical protein
VSPGAWDSLYLVLALLFMARFFYFYAFGVHFGDRALSRSVALAILVFAVAAVVFFARVLL